MSDLIITIARQNGSGGREVGKILADLLGIKCYDQEILSEAAEESGISLQEIEQRPSPRRARACSSEDARTTSSVRGVM